jgi:hypothetical protein
MEQAERSRNSPKGRESSDFTYSSVLSLCGFLSRSGITRVLLPCSEGALQCIDLPGRDCYV